MACCDYCHHWQSPHGVSKQAHRDAHPNSCQSLKRLGHCLRLAIDIRSMASLQKSQEVTSALPFLPCSLKCHASAFASVIGGVFCHLWVDLKSENQKYVLVQPSSSLRSLHTPVSFPAAPQILGTSSRDSSASSSVTWASQC